MPERSEVGAGAGQCGVSRTRRFADTVSAPRDVHGMLAVRIPGFWFYTQYHLEPCAALAAGAFEMDGFAEVIFRDETDRAGLATSEVTPLILRDETNVFSRTLLYGLEAGASRNRLASESPRMLPDWCEPEASYVLVAQSPPGASAQAEAAALETELLPRLEQSAGLGFLRTHLLASGDPSRWNTAPGVNNAEAGARNSVLIQGEWTDRPLAQAALARLGALRPDAFAGLQAYRVTERCAMVVRGQPTHLGLRGLDALRTIEEVGADNQKSPEVLRQIYRVSMPR